MAVAKSNSVITLKKPDISVSVKNISVKSDFVFYTRLVLLYLLNVVDWLCTEVLISSGLFVEANPVMQAVLNDFFLTLTVKGVLPLVLIEICALVYRAVPEGESNTVRFIINFGIIAYFFVILWHILNFVLLFFHF